MNQSRGEGSFKMCRSKGLFKLRMVRIYLHATGIISVYIYIKYKTV